MSRLSPRAWFAILLLSGVAIRVAFWLAYDPLVFPDTPSYMHLSTVLRTGDWSTFDGRRPPAYPAMLALAGNDVEIVWALQMLAGLGIAALLFLIVLRATGRPGLATLAGTTYNLNLAQVFFEANLLAETISTLLVAGAATMLVAWEFRYRSRDGSRWWLLLGIGLLTGVAIMAKPQFIALPVLMAALVAVASRQTRYRARLGRAAMVALPGVLMVIGWSSVNYARLGYFTLSTQAGIGLMNQSLAFVELAPDRYATIRDIYVKHRDAKIALTGRHNANWDAVPELLATTGLSFPALSRELTSLSVTLFVQHPLRYGVGVARAWVSFWMVPIYWAPDRLSPSWLAPWLGGLWRLEHVVLRTVNAVFIGLTIAFVLSARFRNVVGRDLAILGPAVVIHSTALVQALGEYGENARYAVPVQGLIVMVALLVGQRVVSATAFPATLSTAPASHISPAEVKRR